LRPNILLILCDDMGWSDIGCYGGDVRTPHLDRMAAEGLRFTQFYNNAKCTTTRASVLSGLYPRGNGSRLTSDMVSLGEALKLAGYQTALSGKWHLGSQAPHRPIDRGFDEYYGLMDGCCNFFNPVQPDPPYKGGKVRTFGHNDQVLTEFPENYYSTDAFTDHAIATVKRFTRADKPFFLHLCYTAPHYPLHAPAEDIARYRGKYLQGWEVMRRERHERQLAMGLIDPKWKLSGTDSKAYAWETADQDWEDHRMAAYAAMIDRMDQNIGRLLATLKELGIDDNTVVMFLSDNGGCSEEPGGRDPTQVPGIASTYTAVGPAWGWAQNTPFRRYKSWVHEGGIATPLIVRWPGKVKGNTMTAQPGHIIDFMPTFLELAGATYPKEFAGNKILPVEGRSLVPVLEGRTRAPHEQLCWEWSGNCAIRQGKWKLVWDSLNKARQWELYDLEADRTETRDLASQHPDRVQTMRAAYEEWAKATGRKIPNVAAGKGKKEKGRAGL
jgi:arylsulfatase A-like enzyme